MLKALYVAHKNRPELMKTPELTVLTANEMESVQGGATAPPGPGFPRLRRLIALILYIVGRVDGPPANEL